MFTVKPASPDLVLFGPDGKRVPDAGITIPEVTLFWRRRRDDQDAIISEVAVEAEAAPEPKKKG